MNFFLFWWNYGRLVFLKQLELELELARFSSGRKTTERENSCCVLPHLQLAAFLGHGLFGATERTVLDKPKYRYQTVKENKSSYTPLFVGSHGWKLLNGASFPFHDNWSSLNPKRYLELKKETYYIISLRLVRVMHTKLCRKDHS